MARVLVVDDDVTTRRVLGLLLRRKGHHATCVGNGEQALQCLRGGFQPDLVVMDVMMPGINGIEVLGRLNDEGRTSEVPVVMYTALADPDTRDEATRLGAQDYVVKGRGWDELYPKIEKFIS